MGIQRWLSGRQSIVWYDPVLATMKVKPGDHLNIAIIFTTSSPYIPRLEYLEQNAKGYEDNCTLYVYRSHLYYRKRAIHITLFQGLDTLVNSSNAVSQVLPSLTVLTTGNNEASLLDHIPPFGLAGEPLNTLNEILIAVSVSGNDLTDQRNSGETPPLVDKIKHGIVDLAEFQTGKHTTGLQDAECFLQCDILVCEIADTERHSVQIHTVVRDHVQILGIRLYEIQSAGAIVVGKSGAFATFGQHFRIDV